MARDDQNGPENRIEYNRIFFLLKQIYMNLIIYNIVYRRKKIYNSKAE